jgi:hypothetical protein
MTERISPRVDIAFKKIFGVEENKDLLISFANLKKAITVLEVMNLNVEEQEAARGYGEDKLVRTTISLPSSLLYKLEDMALENKRKNKDFRSVSAIIRFCIEQKL